MAIILKEVSHYAPSFRVPLVMSNSLHWEKAFPRERIISSNEQTSSTQPQNLVTDDALQGSRTPDLVSTGIFSCCGPRLTPRP